MFFKLVFSIKFYNINLYIYRKITIKIFIRTKFIHFHSFKYFFSIDALLEGGFITGNLYEFCGLSSTGKTQLCKTIALNLSQYHNLETFWIDTKKDFSGLCLRRMLLSKIKSSSIIEETLFEDNIDVILNNIKIEYIYDPFKFVDALKYILGNIKKFDKLKLLIIDSLPSIWFLFQGDNFKNG